MLWQATLWHPMAEGQLKPLCCGHCGGAVSGPKHCAATCVPGQPGLPCVQNIVHSNPGV
jgi:hypothetical protein